MKNFLEAHADLLDDGRIIRRSQEIPEAFLTELNDIRQADAGARAPDAFLVARVPATVAERWLSEGFDIFREPARAICARLRAEDLQQFLTTHRSI